MDDNYGSDRLFTSRTTKTAAQIISEAKASVFPEARLPPPSKSSNNARSKVLNTERPFTPRQRERHLYHGATKCSSSTNRPSSSVLIHCCPIEEEPGSNSHCEPRRLVKLAPLLPNRVLRKSHSVDLGNNSAESLLPQIRASSAASFSRGSDKLPCIVNGNRLKRHQFRRSSETNKADNNEEEEEEEVVVEERPKTVLESKRVDDFQVLLTKLQHSQDDRHTSHYLERLAVVMSSQHFDIGDRKRLLLPVLSRHLASDNVHILFPLVDLLLLSKVTKSNFVLVSKLLFKLARDDTNDCHFVSRRTLDLYLASALGGHCPVADNEAFVYGYGALKFLSLSSKIVTQLESVGFLHLAVLHLKVMSEAKAAAVRRDDNNNVLFQITACVRNMMNSKKSRAVFTGDLKGYNVLYNVIDSHSTDVDVMCNVARTLSVLTTAEEEDYYNNDEGDENKMVDSLYVILDKHQWRRDIVVRATFCLGNLAAKCDSCRVHLAKHKLTTSLLPALLSAYISMDAEDEDLLVDEAAVDFGSTGSVEDTAIKIIRVFANASIHPEAGSILALDETIVATLVRICKASDSLDNSGLVLPTLATLNNLSFYPIVLQTDTYEALKPYMLAEDTGVATEAARVLGNLSRRSEVRQCLSRDGHFAATLNMLQGCVEDRDLVYACVGIVVNMMSDPEQRPTFAKEGGVKKCTCVLERCLDQQDWMLACLVCQAIWNYCIDTQNITETMDEDCLVGLEDVIVYLLEACNESLSAEEEDEEEVFGQTEFCRVALSLLKRILDDSPRKVELLLDDDA